MCVLARILLLVCFIAHLLVGQATDYDNEGRLVADYDNDKRLAADYDIDKRVAADYDNEEQLAVEYDNEEGIAVDYDKEDSLAILHRLHRAHCGDAALCNNDTITNGSHLEPWMTMFPRPCCAPCSCLPNCEEYQNCCPFIRNLRKGNYTDSVSSSTNRRRDKAKISDMRLQDQWSSGYEDLTKLSFNNHQISSNRHPISSSVTNQLTVVTTIAPKHNNLSHFKTGNTDAEIDGTETACIRPQLFYKPNVHPDSSAYKMVISCPADFPDALKTKKCKAGQNNTNISDAIPITSKLTGLTYVNKHCLFCNEPQVSTASCDEWQIQLDDRYTNYRHRIILYPQSLMYWASNYFFNVHFVPKTQSSVKNCITYDVSSCNQTGLWDNYNKSIESVCRHGDDLPITHSVNGNILLFKNIACVHCNAPPDFSDSRLFCAYMSSYTGYPDFQRPRQTLTLYFNGLAALPKPDIEEIPVSYIETSVLDNIPAVSCGQGLLAILGRCRRIVCPRDHYVETNRCVPLYRSLTGLHINFKLKITPMQNIKRNKGQKVVDELTILVNNSLENIISLQSREISVWYLPKGNKNTVGYYLFDIFLYNDTDKIKYSNAVKEIHDFYNFISSRKSLQVSYGLQNNINIDFEYGIGLGFELTRFGIVDLSVQTGFKSLVKIGDELKLEPLVNHVTISDINWCIRTEFTAVDLETIGRHTHHIKLTNTILFKDQFDTEPYRDSNTLYTCISYLVDENEIKHRNSEMMPDIVGIGDDAPSDSIETHSIVFDKASNAAVAGFILVLILLTLFKVKSALTKRQLRAEDHSDGIETGDRTLRYSVDEPYNRSKLTDNTTVVEDGKRFAENNVKDCLNNERIDEHDHRRTGREVDDCTTEENTIANDDKQAKTITFK